MYLYFELLASGVLYTIPLVLFLNWQIFFLIILSALFFCFKFQTTSVAVSVFTLSAISVERWYAICYPLHFKSTKRRAKIIILVIWIIAFLLALPEIIFAELHRSVQRQYIDLLISCRPSWPSMSNQVVYQGLMMVLMYLLPLILMTVTYSMIAVVLWTGRIPGAIESGGYMFFIILTKSMVLSSRVGKCSSSY